jgi:hypothetical protein
MLIPNADFIDFREDEAAFGKAAVSARGHDQ